MKITYGRRDICFVAGDGRRQWHLSDTKSLIFWHLQDTLRLISEMN